MFTPQGLGIVDLGVLAGISAGQQQCERAGVVRGVVSDGVRDVGGAGQAVQADGQVP